MKKLAILLGMLGLFAVIILLVYLIYFLGATFGLDVFVVLVSQLIGLFVVLLAFAIEKMFTLLKEHS